MTFYLKSIKDSLRVNNILFEFTLLCLCLTFHKPNTAARYHLHGEPSLIMTLFNIVEGPFFYISGGSRGGGLSTMFCSPIFFIRMLKNNAQIARESIKTTLELPGPLSAPWTPAESEFGSALVMCVREHNLLRPPPPPKTKKN